MNIQEIITRNYYATYKRGKIVEATNERQFLNAIKNEVTELERSMGNPTTLFDVKELADVVLVCFSMAKHFGYDIEKELINKTLYNEIRID